MGPLALAAIGAGVGLGKSMLDQQQEKRDRQEAAAIAQWSPWTGMQPDKVKRTDYLGNIAQGGLTGASFGQNMQSQDAYNSYLDRQGSAPVGKPAAGAALAPPPQAVAAPVGSNVPDQGYGWFNRWAGSPWLNNMSAIGNGYNPWG